jgi:protein involved in polysaccharide export with SLBB domain
MKTMSIHCWAFPPGGIRAWVVILLAMVIAANLVARQNPPQERGVSKFPSFRNQETAQQEENRRSELDLITGMPFEETIDPEEYIVGPLDVFGIVVFALSNSALTIPVSLEGSILVPGVGELKVSGLTLKAAKEKILNAIKRVFKVGEPSMTLLASRRFIVTVLGAVRSPGPYVMSSTLRVDKVIALANLNSQAVFPNQSQWTGDFSRRSIIIRRLGRPEQVVDLELFYSKGQRNQNPFLREGDVIYVPPKSLDQASVSVYGAVNQPGQYEHREYDSLWSLIRIANGLTPNADPSTVEVSEFPLNAESVSIRTIDIRPIMRGEQPDISVNNKSRILVREKGDRRRDFKVYVRGEIMFPGMYPITSDSTRLSDVIRRAGGFTEYAYLPGAEMERKQLTLAGESVDSSMESMLNLRMNDQLIAPEERAYYELESRLRRGTVIVDFVQLFSRNDPSADVPLKDGDIIFVPNATRTVYVLGQVPKPGYVSFKKDAPLDYYIWQAGGYGDEAEAGETRIIKTKSREWKEPSDTVIEPGDNIWVPKKTRYTFGYYMNMVSQAASIISVALSMTVIIIQLSK